MATRKIPEKQPEAVAVTRAIEEDIGDDDVSFSSPTEDKPKTAQELYRALVENGFIDGWKDRTDIGDSYARNIRINGTHSTRRAVMATRKRTPHETHKESAPEADTIDDEMFESPSSSPDKKVLTGRALLESGLVGLWKDRTDIGDTLEYVQKLKDQGRERRQKRIRKYMSS
ncbi:MAG: hypothetical protein ACR2JW_01330 [Thermomicrobiales bacterium]